MDNLNILIRGGGEAASAVAHKLVNSGFKVCLTEIQKPLAIHRGTSFSEVIWEKEKEVENICVKLALTPKDIYKIWDQGKTPLIIDSEADIRKEINPDILIDAIMEKRNIGTSINYAPLVIALGPGFKVGKDAHLVIETNNSDNLGKVLIEGEAESYNPIPLEVGGYTFERVLRNLRSGVLYIEKDMGEIVDKDEVVAWVKEEPLKAKIGGLIRAILRDGTFIKKQTKVAEIDPRNDPKLCYTIRPRMRTIAGGTLEAILYWHNRKKI